MKINVIDRRHSAKTHEGAPAKNISALQELRRSTLTALLWEDLFYEKGNATAARVATLIKDLVANGQGADVANLAKEARDLMYLRHMPLFIVRELARQTKRGKANAHLGSLVAETLHHVIQRADELTEYLAIYWKDKADMPLSAASKRGLAMAFRKFNAYQLGKYNRDGAIKLRDVLRIVRPKPTNAEQSALWKSVVKGTLEAPDTWEVALSAGANKRATWERLLTEDKLGALAFLRNLRNMLQAGVNQDLIHTRFKGEFKKVLPFRFLAAAKHAVQLVPHIETAMLRAADALPKLGGRTVLLVDVSGSMDAALSSKSDLLRLEAACALSILLREVCEEVRVFTFSEHLREVPAYRGFGLNDAVVKSQPHGGTYLGKAVTLLNKQRYDRLIVLTDEQSADRVPDPVNGTRGYMINVAAHARGVGYGAWTHIDGFSERVLDFVHAYEAS